MELNNKILKSFILKADALDRNGDPATDGSLHINGLWALTPTRAIEVYKQLSSLVRDLQEEIDEAERLGKIAYHEEELQRLKTKEVE